MYLGPYTLFEIVEQNEETFLKIWAIDLDIKHPFNHSFKSNCFPLNGNNLETCKKQNDEQVKLLLESKAEIEIEISQGYDGSKTFTQLDYIKNTLIHFRKWYKEKGLEFPDSDIYIQQPERKSKYQEYEELFNRFLSDPNANPDEVKSILNDKTRWKNPSAYLSSARRKVGLTVSKLKSHSGFTWIDPKGTAVD
jgi:hypothetical protein